MEVLIDTNFIISCIIKKIDFLSQIEEKGFKAVIPKEVIDELKDLKFKKGQSREDKEAIEVALSLFSSKRINKMSLGVNKVDNGLIKKGKEGIYLATLDREIKRQVPNRIVILDAKNEIGIERD